MEGYIGPVFIMIQFNSNDSSNSGTIDLLDFFYRSWNAELLRNVALEPMECILRFPLLSVSGVVYSGVVASVLSSGVVRVVSSGSVDDAMDIADFVYAYVSRRLAPHFSAGCTKSLVMFRAILDPVPQPLCKRKNVDTSDEAAEWLRKRISSCVAAAVDHNGDDSPQMEWWRSLTESSVTHRQHRNTLRVVCCFKHPQLRSKVRNKDGVYVMTADDDRGNIESSDADLFFLCSELFSAIPLGGGFVAAEHDTEKSYDENSEKRKHNKKENEKDGNDDSCGRSSKRFCSENDKTTVEAAFSRSQDLPKDEVLVGVSPPRKPLAGVNVAGASKAMDACPLVEKSHLKIEMIVYRTGRVSTVSDSVEGLSFVLEHVVLPLFNK